METFYNYLTLGMAALAAVVFVILYFVTAGYIQFHASAYINRSIWNWRVDNYH